MLKIRLTRTGKKNEPSFRIILVEARTKPKSSRYLEILGNYNPVQKRVNLNKERISTWLSKGAKPSATVHNLLVKSGIISGPKIRKGRIKKKETKKEEVK